MVGDTTTKALSRSHEGYLIAVLHGYLSLSFFLFYQYLWETAYLTQIKTSLKPQSKSKHFVQPLVLLHYCESGIFQNISDLR